MGHSRNAVTFWKQHFHHYSVRHTYPTPNDCFLFPLNQFVANKIGEKHIIEEIIQTAAKNDLYSSDIPT